MPAPGINPRRINPKYEFNENKFLYAVSNVPYIGDVIKAQQRTQKLNDYLTNYGLSWDDIKYPALLGGGAYNQLMNIPADSLSAIERLYDQRERIRRSQYMDAKRHEMYDTSIKANRMRQAWYYSRM